MTSFYTTTEWAALSTEAKLAFSSVKRVTFRRGGRIVTEWKATS